MHEINGKLLEPSSEMQIIENFNRMYKMAEAIKDGIAKSNTNATTAPTKTDDNTEGYKIGSTWIYNGITYTCIDNTSDNAEWVSTEDIYYFDSWSALVSAISVVGTTYVGKHATIANANGAPSSGVTYVAPTSLTDIIVDGGSATFKINAQGTNYSVTCQVRTVTNPVIKKVYLISEAKPTTAGYYIFSVTPTDGLPSGINLNDIAYYNGSVWSVFQSYSSASAVLVAGTTTNTQITWRKFNGTWMSTADDFIPDGNEYQTGKLYNGKPVYRKCLTGTTSSNYSGYNNDTGATIPLTGTMLLCMLTVVRSGQRFNVTMTEGVVCPYVVPASGKVYIWVNNSQYASMSYTLWVEYTKS